jgi:hypothetical protein
MKTLLAAVTLALVVAGCQTGPSTDQAAAQHKAAAEKCGCKAVCANCACSHCGSKSETCPCTAHTKDGCACVCKGGGTTNCLCASCSTGKGGCNCPK